MVSAGAIDPRAQTGRKTSRLCAARDRLRQVSGADPSASGATRVAGTVNFKRPYAPDFPTVQILQATPRRIVTRDELEAAGLAAAADPIPVMRPVRGRPHWRAKAWPSYERCLQNAPPAHHSDRPDVSRADFPFACWRSIGAGASRRPASACWRKAAKPVRMEKATPGSPRNAPPPPWIEGQQSSRSEWVKIFGGNCRR